MEALKKKLGEAELAQARMRKAAARWKGLHGTLEAELEAQRSQGAAVAEQLAAAQEAMKAKEAAAAASAQEATQAKAAAATAAAAATSAAAPESTPAADTSRLKGEVEALKKELGEAEVVHKKIHKVAAHWRDTYWTAADAAAAAAAAPAGEAAAEGEVGAAGAAAV